MVRKEEYIEKIRPFLEDLNEFLHDYEDTNTSNYLWLVTMLWVNSLNITDSK